MKTISLTGLLPDEISELLPEGSEKYRGEQIFRWIHEHGAVSFNEMTNLSKKFREKVSTDYVIGTIKNLHVKRSSDSTTDKYVWELYDGNTIESVIIRDDNRITACISSQVGCKLRCSFCRTGLMGFIRNLSCGEIVDQLIKMKSDLNSNGEQISNVVFMGMGEPLDNIDAVFKAISIINMETAFYF